MEILPSAHNVVIHNSQFTEQTIQVKNNISTSSSGIDVLLQASSPGAFHDSIIRDPQPRCFPGTREQYIEDITQWAAHERPSDSEPDWPVYWMRGPAGVGKTAIAQTCAEKLKERGYLGAAFFFSIHGRDDYTRLFPSIAYQLSTELPDYRQLLDSRISNDKTLVAKDMERQFQSLISGPLKELQESGKDVGKRAILIDGLDECRSRDMQCKIVEIIAASIQDPHFPLRWAFLSRPDEHIEATFKSKNIKSLCLLKELKISRAYDNEIELYLRSSFQDILQRRIHCTQSPWPSDEAIKRLVEACAGLFLYAETLLRYIRLAGSLGPVKQLNQVLEAISGTSTPGATSSSPFEELDAFYALILRRIHKDILPNVQKLLGFMFIYSFHATLFWGAVNLSNQLRFSNDEFLTVFSELRAILCFHEYNELVADESYPGSIVSLARLRHAPSSENYAQVRQEAHFLGGVITLYHKSFWDFLRDPVRSGKFCVSTPEVYDRIFQHYVELWRDCQENYVIQDSDSEPLVLVDKPQFQLSWPQEDPFVTAYSYARCFITSGEVLCSLSFRYTPKISLLRAVAKLNHRKHILCQTSPLPTGLAILVHGFTYDCDIVVRRVHNTLFRQIRPSDFKEFNVGNFMRMVNDWEKSGLIRPHPRSLIAKIKSRIHRSKANTCEEPGLVQRRSSSFMSTIKSLVKRKESHIKTGLYTMGRGPGAVFWYWIINLDLQYLYEYWTPDVVEGTKLFQEQDFGSWAAAALDAGEFGKVTDSEQTQATRVPNP